jgi:hypothetical protein
MLAAFRSAAVVTFLAVVGCSSDDGQNPSNATDVTAPTKVSMSDSSDEPSNAVSEFLCEDFVFAIHVKAAELCREPIAVQLLELESIQRQIAKFPFSLEQLETVQFFVGPMPPDEKLVSKDNPILPSPVVGMVIRFAEPTDLLKTLNQMHGPKRETSDLDLIPTKEWNSSPLIVLGDTNKFAKFAYRSDDGKLLVIANSEALLKKMLRKDGNSTEVGQRLSELAADNQFALVYQAEALHVRRAIVRTLEHSSTGTAIRTRYQTDEDSGDQVLKDVQISKLPIPALWRDGVATTESVEITGNLTGDTLLTGTCRSIDDQIAEENVHDAISYLKKLLENGVESAANDSQSGSKAVLRKLQGNLEDGIEDIEIQHQPEGLTLKVDAGDWFEGFEKTLKTKN